MIMIESEGITEKVETWRTDVVAPDRRRELGLEKVMFEAADPEVFALVRQELRPRGQPVRRPQPDRPARMPALGHLGDQEPLGTRRYLQGLSGRRSLMITVKRVYEPFDARDGTRFLVERLWPRGMKKDSLRIDGWLKDVAPSGALRRWFGHDPAKWDEFRRRYAAELDRQPEAWQPILEAAQARRCDVALQRPRHRAQQRRSPEGVSGTTIEGDKPWLKVAINGLGRIGRAALKIVLDTPELELVAANDIASPENLAYLLKYDTVYGRYEQPVASDEDSLTSPARSIGSFAKKTLPGCRGARWASISCWNAPASHQAEDWQSTSRPGRRT